MSAADSQSTGGVVDEEEERDGLALASASAVETVTPGTASPPGPVLIARSEKTRM